MPTCIIHQIYYSPQSFTKLDSGFTPLNNSDGPPEVREYWPIREYFLNNAVNDDDLIGFFSPLFYEKTGLTSADVYEHIAKNPGNDVYLFNPYFHIAAWHLNIFTQGEMSHPGLIKILNETMQLMDVKIDVGNIVMSSTNAVYCNFFVAKVKFWKQWLMISEFIYALSEIDDTDHGKFLSSNTSYIKEDLPMRVFIIERIASLLLANPNSWKTSSKLIFKDMQHQTDKPIPFLEKMLALDSLKSAFIQTQNPLYLNTYNFEREFLMINYGLRV